MSVNRNVTVPLGGVSSFRGSRYVRVRKSSKCLTSVSKLVRWRLWPPGKRFDFDRRRVVGLDLFQRCGFVDAFAGLGHCEPERLVVVGDEVAQIPGFGRVLAHERLDRRNRHRVDGVNFGFDVDRRPIRVLFAHASVASSALMREIFAKLVEIFVVPLLVDLADHRIDRRHAPHRDAQAGVDGNRAAPRVTDEHVDRFAECVHDVLQVANAARQRHRAGDVVAVAVAALIVRDHAETARQMVGEPLPAAAGTGHSVNGEHERAALAPRLHRRVRPVIQDDAMLLASDDAGSSATRRDRRPGSNAPHL